MEYNSLKTYLKVLFRFHCYLLLFIVKIEYYRAILGSYVVALSIQLSWVVVGPKDVQQLFISNLFGVIYYTNYFCVSSSICTNIFIGRILGFSSTTNNGKIIPSYTTSYLRITNSSRINTFGLPKLSFSTPKTTKSKHGIFVSHLLKVCRKWSFQNIMFFRLSNVKLFPITRPHTTYRSNNLFSVFRLISLLSNLFEYLVP